MGYLTIIPDTSCDIMGAVARVPEGSWDALDARERAYECHDVTREVDAESPCGVVRAYAIAPGRHMAPTPEHPILQSYVDVVLAGYERLFGASGVEAFITTTSGWQAPILQDRDAPRYPRAQTIDASTLSRFDEALDAIGVTRI